MTKPILRPSVDLLKSLAHPVRLRILSMLRDGELCVCQITEVIGLAPSSISEHLSALRRSGLVTERKEAKWVIYTLTEDPALLALCESLWSLIDGDASLCADRKACVKVRKVPIPVTCKAQVCGKRIAKAGPRNATRTTS